MNEVTQTLTLRGLDSESIDLAMARALTDRGYAVYPPGHIVGGPGPTVEGKWEKPGELCARIGIHPGSLRRTMDRPECPKPRAANRGMSGRLISLISTPELDGFLVRYKWGGDNGSAL